MDNANTLRRYGLFDAKVPRYTSYPPANRFQLDVGARYQRDWLGNVSPDETVSLYVHIPFCRRLCWFCACRTQGTQTLKPVEGYLEVLHQEIDTIASRYVASGTKMSRLHLGGGTPTLLSAPLMERLLDKIHQHFAPADDFEFSVEIDPTEAEPEVLQVLSEWNMTRASVGVQDFAPKVQEAIGRIQGYELTRDVIDQLRDGGVGSLNVDFLYGLPFQTTTSLAETLDRVVMLQPDRLALYGYAHVPHVSKRQVMIPGDELPDAEQRFEMSQIAKNRLVALGYEALGIDHFALPGDSLTRAARAGTMKRNFQGYTDDPCETLIGFGASAISRFREGFLQNAVATSAYCQRVQESGLAAHKGYALSSDDEMTAALIDAVMCQGKISIPEMAGQFPERLMDLSRIVDGLWLTFPDILERHTGGVEIKPDLFPAARLIAAHLDEELNENHKHSLAI